jgi:hypothetical protein
LGSDFDGAGTPEGLEKMSHPYPTFGRSWSAGDTAAKRWKK